MRPGCDKGCTCIKDRNITTEKLKKHDCGNCCWEARTVLLDPWEQLQHMKPFCSVGPWCLQIETGYCWQNFSQYTGVYAPSLRGGKEFVNLITSRFNKEGL